MPPAGKVVILGAGSIGLSFAAVFADNGYQVTLVEPDAARRAAVAGGLATQREAILAAGLGQGKAGGVEAVETGDLALRDAALVIECGPENLGIKQAIFADLFAKTDPSCLLATASSAITMSEILPAAAAQARAFVAHPVNPPAVLRMIELVPAPATTPETMRRGEAIFNAAGFTSVVLGHEIEGFVLNRLQGAVLREAYRLVADGVVSVQGLEAVMRLGLGPRWALSGPFETVELNTPGGIKAHALRMGPAYTRMGEARGETRAAWPEDLVEDVHNQRRAVLDLDRLPERAAWRARSVAALVALRDRLMS